MAKIAKINLLIPLLIAYIFISMGYFLLPKGPQAFPTFFLIISSQFLIYLAVLFNLRKKNIPVSWIIGVGILLRFLLIYSAPVLENDYWRYLWDGRVLAHGINPYLYKPLDPALNFLNTNYRQLIGWKQFGTIYPPFSLLIFALTHKIIPDSLIALKFVLCLFDIGTGVIVILWLKELKIEPKWSALYFLNPLVLKEISNSAHLDSIAVFFSVFAGFLLWKGLKDNLNRMIFFSWIILAFAVTSKLYPICLFPLFFKLDKRKWTNVFVFFSIIAISYLPFFSAGIHLINGTEAFARYWIFNASFFRLFQQGAIHILALPFFSDFLSIETLNILLRDDKLAKIGTAFFFGIFVLWRAKKLQNKDGLIQEIINILACLILLSPVVNGWYILWILPFACLTKNIPWISFTYLVIAGYAWWFSKELSMYLRWTEYIVFFSLLVFYYIKTRKQKLILRAPDSSLTN